MLPGRVHRAAMPSIMSNCSCAIVTSSEETFGHNILEPLVYGIPVITTDVGIASDLVYNQLNGIILYSPDDLVNQLEQAMSHLLDNRLHYASYATKFSSYYKSIYTWENVSLQVLHSINRLL